MKGPLKIGFGGGCHWCTEAIFNSLIGVTKVAQGFIATKDDTQDFSEAVIVHFDERLIGLNDLIAVHLHTHQSTKNHSMRIKYRSAVYFFDFDQEEIIQTIIDELQEDFTERIITQVLPFGGFKPSETRFQNYYYTNTERPFCKTHISPKITLLRAKFSKHLLEKIDKSTT